jgi:hypothetical protein
MRTKTLIACVVVASSVLIGRTIVAQQLTYSKGQTMSPAFEGWEKNADGSFNMLFGYMNRNWEEELDVPIGPDNNISPGELDQGQPTHFLPRRNRFVFKVKVPPDFGTKELVWTLTSRGKTEKAYATLRQDSFVDDLVQGSEQGALGPGTSNPRLRANKAPTLKVDGEDKRSVRVGEPLTLVAWATDDGVPRPRRSAGASFPVDPPPPGTPPMNPAWRPPAQITVGSAVGLRLSWYVYRGGGKATFSPEQTKVWEDTRTGANSPWAPRWVTPPAPPEGKWVTEVTFEQPGTYVLRCLAHDGIVGADHDVTVTVAPTSR